MKWFYKIVNNFDISKLNISIVSTLIFLSNVFIVVLFIVSIFGAPKKALVTKIDRYQRILSESTTSEVEKTITDLTLGGIFIFSDPVLFSFDKTEIGKYTIIATGDVIPARVVNQKVTGLNNFNFPYENVSMFLNSADAVFVNLESPLIPNCPVTNIGMIFCGDERNVNGLVNANVRVAGVANNHMGNYGLDGITNTVNLLSQKNIQVTGNNNSAMLKIKNKKFGFLAYNDVGGRVQGISWADIPQIQKDILNLKNKVDFVIVAFHWGDEYVINPNERQIELAHAAIDSGADLIIGNHPHWVQGTEIYKGKFITYAHGNFVFDQMWSQETREGVMGLYTFSDSGLSEVKFIPIIIDNYSQPRYASKPEAEKILSRMKESSENISAGKLQ